MAPLPMFPLGSVLFPGGVLPLHVFEPRYRALVEDCLGDEPEFGVVLIERGSEVGGGDVRRPVGTVARIVQAGRFEDGRYALVTVGTRRFTVRRWLDDDPYPRAEVEDFPDDPIPDDASLRDALDPVLARLRRVLALHAEAGDDVADATADVADDPLVAVHHACALAPLGPADQYALLSTRGPQARLERLSVMLADDEDLLRFRLGGNDEGQEWT
jgi:uncharacterized protein